MKLVRTIAVVTAIVLLSGCVSLNIAEKDQVTIDQIDVTIQNEQETYLKILNAVKGDGVMSIVKILKILHESELERLQAWKEYEESKPELGTK